MSGGEVPVSKIAVSAAKTALTSTSEEKQQLGDIAKESPAMKLAGEKYAQRLLIKQGILLKLYQPLAKWAGASREYFEQDFADDMGEKIADIPDEELKPPPPSVAVPAMQGLGYSLDDPTLKEMYLNLLATASDGRRREGAHPSFAEIIRQLSGREAGLLPTFLHKGVEPVARLNRKNPAGTGSGHVLIANHVLPLRNIDTGPFVEEPLLPVWIENWCRLGLVEVDYGRFLTHKDAYTWIDDHPSALRIVQNDERGRNALRIDRGMLRPTEFGRTFAKAATPRPEDSRSGTATGLGQ